MITLTKLLESVFVFILNPLVTTTFLEFPLRTCHQMLPPQATFEDALRLLVFSQPDHVWKREYHMSAIMSGKCYLVSTQVIKKIEFSPYVRKFRREWLQSLNKTKYLRISSYIIASLASYMTLQPIPSEFPYVWRKLSFLFYQCRSISRSTTTTAPWLPRRSPKLCLWSQLDHTETESSRWVQVFPRQFLQCSVSITIGHSVTSAAPRQYMLDIPLGI